MCLRLYLLLAALRVLLPILGFSQQVGEGQRFEGAGAGGPGIPERVVVPRVPPAPDRAQRARAHAARGVDAVDADHLGGLSRDPTDKKKSKLFMFPVQKILGPAFTASTERRGGSNKVQPVDDRRSASLQTRTHVTSFQTVDECRKKPRKRGGEGV